MKNFDNAFLDKNIKLIAGVDEAGRGPLAGPVVAAAVMFDDKTFIKEVNDSKQLKENVRERLFDEIREKALCYGVGIVDHLEIDRINILNASLLAMKMAVNELAVKPDLVLIDGNKTFYSSIPAKPIVKGDAKSFAIAAASIIAKVTRDRLMVEAAKEFPGYSWEKNKGYGTKEHVLAIKKIGYCSLHRRSFLGKIISSDMQLTVKEL